MKKLLLGALVALTSLAAFAVPEGAKHYNSRVLCAPTDNWIEYHTGYVMVPTLAGEKSKIIAEDGTLVEGIVVLWYNKESDTYSLTFTPDKSGELTCAIAWGESLSAM